MLRSLLCAASIVVFLFATVFFPHVISARRCSVKMPSTLLSLYRASDFIYVGKFDKIEEGEASKEQESDVTIVPIKKHFSIASSLKGESRKLLVLEESEYRYVNDGAAEVPEAESENESEDTAETESTSEESGDAASGEVEEEIRTDDEAEAAEGEETEGEAPASQAKPGDTVLLFLLKDEEGEGLHLADDPDGLKKMTSESLAAYELRIKELNEIFSAKDPGYAEIVAWLIRCAEDPATRWEGTYELLRSFTNFEWQEERAREVAANPAADVVSYSPRTPGKFETGDVNFAKYLTEGQKLILSNILLSRKIAAKQDDPTTSFVHGDRELIELVKRWGDSKVAATLIEQLIHDSSDLLMSSGLMSSIAAMLRDEKLIGLASMYSDIQWQAADATVEGEYADRTTGTATKAENSRPEGDGEAADAETSEATSDAARVEPASEENAVPMASKKAPAKEKTYGELRAELLSKFLDRAGIVMAKEDSRNEN